MGEQNKPGTNPQGDHQTGKRPDERSGERAPGSTSDRKPGQDNAGREEPKATDRRGSTGA